MDKELIEELKTKIDNIQSIEEINEVIKYANKRKFELKPTLHDILDPYFKEHPNTWFFILGFYGKNEEGGVYTGSFDFDYLDILEYSLSDDEKYSSLNECLNCAIFGSTIKECKPYEENSELIEKIKQAKDFPKISETKAYELPYDDEVIFIYNYREDKIEEI